MFRIALSALPDYPGTFSGQGIVTCGGGIKYGTCAWVLIQLLRMRGCTLPIEVWCLDDDEYDPAWIELVAPLGVTCVNAAEVARKHPHPRLRGWELKPYAIKHSRFQEVLFLDADNVPLVDPTYLFDAPEYQDAGTVFWPDPEHFRTLPENANWGIFGVQFRDSPDQESGQLLIDKSRCWRALCLCNWYNERSDFYYKYVYGDKETFRYAWQRLEQPIAWPAKYPSEDVRFTLLQHDFAGRAAFQHRYYRKWSLYGRNRLIPGFQDEDLCLEFIDELRERWRPQRHLMRRGTAADHRMMEALTGQRFLYERPGYNQWPIRLGPEGRIDEGYGANEFFWWCEEGRLVLAGREGQTRCSLEPAGHGRWRGERSRGSSRVEVLLSPLRQGTRESDVRESVSAAG